MEVTKISRVALREPRYLGSIPVDSRGFCIKSAEGQMLAQWPNLGFHCEALSKETYVSCPQVRFAEPNLLGRSLQVLDLPKGTQLQPVENQGSA